MYRLFEDFILRDYQCLQFLFQLRTYLNLEIALK